MVAECQIFKCQQKSWKIANLCVAIFFKHSSSEKIKYVPHGTLRSIKLLYFILHRTRVEFDLVQDMLRLIDFEKPA